MDIHEYQAKNLLREVDIPVPDGIGVESLEALEPAVNSIAAPSIVVKAQIHAGGRGKGHFIEAEAGKGGGVRICHSRKEAIAQGRVMFGRNLVTHQTDAGGRQVNRLYLEAGSVIKREYYLALLVDRSSSCVSFIASTAGGMDIEEVAARSPDKVATIPIDPVTGFQPHHARHIARSLLLTGDLAKQCANLAGRLYRLFLQKDCNLIEVNPLVVTDNGQLLCLDCKMNFDDSALYRHPELVKLRDESEEDPCELRASKYDLSYIALEGEIGCMVNGAGLAMATMDIIKLYGAEPANFLDVGGGASAEKVTEAFKIITSDQNVKAILVNIFGGIMRCDIIAKGVISAVKQVGLKVPLIVRLEGTNVEAGKKILATSDIEIIAADNLADAAEKAVASIS